jgi:hypothetical protein
VKTENIKLFILNNEYGVITYTATFETADESLFKKFIILEIYSKIKGSWQNTFYQQIPAK